MTHLSTYKDLHLKRKKTNVQNTHMQTDLFSKCTSHSLKNRSHTVTHISSTHWSACSPFCASASWLLDTAGRSASTLTAQCQSDRGTLVHIWVPSLLQLLSRSLPLALSLSLLYVSLPDSIANLNSLQLYPHCIFFFCPFFPSPGVSPVPYQQTVLALCLY